MSEYNPLNSTIDGSKSNVTEEAAFPVMVQIDLRRTAAAVTEVYRNFVVVKVNDHCVRMAVMQGEYRWHRHPHSDECLLTMEGSLEIDLEDGQTIKLLQGEAFTVPAGMIHRTRSHARSVNLCFENLDAYTDVEFMDDFAAGEHGVGPKK